jgi:hypothetical protein
MPPLHDLTPLAPAAAGSLAPADLAAVRAFAHAEKASATRKAYASDWAIFRSWCAARDATPLPAAPATVAAFLAAEAEAGTKAATINRRAATIAEPPTNTELVRATLKGIHRTNRTVPPDLRHYAGTRVHRRCCLQHPVDTHDVAPNPNRSRQTISESLRPLPLPLL